MAVQITRPSFSFEGSKNELGSFGSVIRARISETNEIVAIKQIKLEKRVFCCK
jgi:hypothetical protein